MMRLIDAYTLKKLILEERDKIPITVPAAYYEMVKEKPFRDGELMRGGIRKALRCLENCPTVDPIKHGRWHLLDDCANEGVYCSVCHKKVYRTDYANQKVKSKFCPNCGAKMDVEG